jgi:hypothetical protein
MNMPGRSFNSSAYRYGAANGQEKSTEINENSYTAEYWQYDARLVRRWNVDPVKKEYESPYAAFGNNPIWLSDVNGADTTLNSPNGSSVNLSDDVSNIKTFSGNSLPLEGFSNTMVTPSKGSLQSYDKYGQTFRANFNTSSGEFIGYLNSNNQSESQYVQSVYWALFKNLTKLNSGINEFDIYGSAQVKFTRQVDKIFTEKDKYKLVVPFGIQAGYNSSSGGYWGGIGPKDLYLNVGYGPLDVRVSKGKGDYYGGDYIKSRALLTVYPSKAVKVQLDAAGDIMKPSTYQVGARVTAEQELFKSNTPLAPSVSVEAAAGFRVHFFAKPFSFIGLLVPKLNF